MCTQTHLMRRYAGPIDALVITDDCIPERIRYADDVDGNKTARFFKH